MSFCSLEEAFAGPSMGSSGGKKKTKHRGKEGFVPGPLSGSPDPDRPSVVPPPPANDVLTGPPMDRAVAQMESGSAVKLDDLFPLPGETGSLNEWEKAFTLDGSQVPSLRPNGAAAIAGGPTLWRQAAALVPRATAPLAAAGGSSMTESMSALPGQNDVTTRLETLTRQLESLTTPSPMQGTAELFLFVAIGLLLLLAIDTLLRFAVSVASAAGSGSKKMIGGRRWTGRTRFY
jgi:hypothetical protein